MSTSKKTCRDTSTVLGLLSTTLALTGNIKRSITTNGLSQVIAGNTGVDTLIWFAPASMYNTEKEEGAARQEHAMRTGVIPVCLNTLPILVPLYSGGGTSLCFAVESGGFPPGDNQIRGVLHNPWCTVFKSCPGPCKVKMRTNIIHPSVLPSLTMHTAAKAALRICSRDAFLCAEHIYVDQSSKM